MMNGADDDDDDDDDDDQEEDEELPAMCLEFRLQEFN